MNSHHIYQCKDFQNLSSQERHRFIKERGFCFNCLSDKHKSLNCQSKNSCIKCGKRHHTYLHLESKLNEHSFTENRDRNTSNITNQSNAHLRNHQINANKNKFVAISAKTQTSVLLATTLANLSNCDGRKFQARGILDSAA